jgi:mycofactocin glycosyltransferase
MTAIPGNPPAASVVVPVYNSERTLEPLIDSLLALDYPRECVEFIVVDNGSTDGTAAILARFADRIQRVVEPKRGRSAARNRGIAEARHDLVAFTDADCVLHPMWLRHLLPPLLEPGVGISGGRIQAVEPCNAIAKFGEFVRDHNLAINVYKPPYVDTSNWASPKSVLVAMGGFDEGLPRCEDVDLAFRIFQSGYRIVYSDDALVRHRNRSSWKGLFKDGFEHGFHSVPVLTKHYAFLQGIGYRRFHAGRIKPLATDLGRLVRGDTSAAVLCPVVFESGKKFGKIAGSIRFRSLHL